MKRISLMFCLGFFLLFCLTPGFAQTGTTSLRGTVMDPNGLVIPDARVTLASAEIGLSLTTQTDKNGFYQFQDVRPATYVLTVSAPGFATLKKSGLALLVSTPATSDVQLQIASGMTTVEVQANTETVNTQDATLGNTFESKQILALPFEGRDAAGVLSLQPGVTFIASADPQNNVDTRNGALNGGRSDQANITLDGVDNNQQSTGTAFQGAVRSTLDSIEEFRVTTIGDNADQGRSSGGQVTLVTKSGTNTFHGSLYEQNRPTVTASNDWFNKQTELSNGLPNIAGKVIRNTFGGSLGGPILKDRLFFFGTYEGQRLAENQQVQRNVPAPNLQDGVVIYPCAPTLDADETCCNRCPGVPWQHYRGPDEVVDRACGSVRRGSRSDSPNGSKLHRHWFLPERARSKSIRRQRPRNGGLSAISDGQFLGLRQCRRIQHQLL